MSSNRTLSQLRAAAGCTLAALTAAGMPAAAAQAARGPRLDRVERAALHRVNHIRRENGLPRLRASYALQRSADYHSLDMLRANFFAHDSSNGQSFAQRVEHYRRSHRIGETLAYVTGRSPRHQAAMVVRMWMHSPPHRASLLSRRFRRIGIARRKGWLGGTRAVVFTADLASAH